MVFDLLLIQDFLHVRVHALIAFISQNIGLVKPKDCFNELKPTNQGSTLHHINCEGFTSQSFLIIKIGMESIIIQYFRANKLG